MNPDTRQLELVEPQSAALKQIPAQRIRTNYEIELTQIPEPHKLRWTTFKIGEEVAVARTKRGPAHTLRVHNIHADGLLLRGRDLAKWYTGQLLFVKGEKCRVVRVSSKGLYVRGA